MKQFRQDTRALSRILNEALLKAGGLALTAITEANKEMAVKTHTAIQEAVAHVEMLIAMNEVHCEGKEPLNESEESIYDNLRTFLSSLTNDEFESLTHEQRFSAARVMMRQGGPGLRSWGVQSVSLSDHLGLKFANIYIGIEKDGYAHS